MLIVKHIEKQFHAKKIINDVSFSVTAGQIAVLLGESGVGKSTILRALCNLESLDGGSISLNGKSLDFSKVGMVFQDFNLFAHLNVLENVILPLIHVAKIEKNQAEQIATQMLSKFSINDLAGAYPTSLSGGQKQRVALARALCMQPMVLCMDEPTSALDPHLKQQVAEIIVELAQQNMILVIATHDIGLIEKLPCTIYLMQQGKIIETATSQQLQENINDFINIKNFIQGKK
jgi:ABC-type polar amino acid transport system ATPase subunit